MAGRWHIVRSGTRVPGRYVQSLDHGLLAASEGSVFVQLGYVSRTVTDTFSARSDIANSTSPWPTLSSIRVNYMELPFLD